MEKQAVDRMLQLEELLREDAEYQHLMAEYAQISPRFLAMLETLEREQQDILCDYLGLLIQMHTEMLLKACE